GGEQSRDPSATFGLMAKEGQRMGINGSEYARVCMEQNFIFSPFEENLFLTENSLARNRIFGYVNHSKALRVLEARFPSQYAMMMRREAMYVRLKPKFVEEADTHLRYVASNYIQTRIITAKNDIIDQMKNWVKWIQEVTTDYDLLSERAKESLEINACYSTIVKSFNRMEKEIKEQYAPGPYKAVDEELVEERMQFRYDEQFPSNDFTGSSISSYETV
ncbi:hypothetical protein PMAYCL1PPCAC_26802, partial [Pristionchus mayeri]